MDRKIVSSSRRNNLTFMIYVWSRVCVTNIRSRSRRLKLCWLPSSMNLSIRIRASVTCSVIYSYWRSLNDLTLSSFLSFFNSSVNLLDCSGSSLGRFTCCVSTEPLSMFSWSSFFWTSKCDLSAVKFPRSAAFFSSLVYTFAALGPSFNSFTFRVAFFFRSFIIFTKWSGRAYIRCFSNLAVLDGKCDR